MFPSNYSKLIRITINGRGYFARYYNKSTAKKNNSSNGWHIEVPTGSWFFDDTIGNMKREVKRTFPTATFHKVK